MRQQKVYLTIIASIFIFFINLNCVNAKIVKTYTGVINTPSGLNIRQSTSSNAEYIGTVSPEEILTYTENDFYDSTDESDTCESKKWIYIEKYKGYACSSYITQTSEKDVEDYTDTEMSKLTEEEFEQYLDSQKFPETYKVYLRELHKKYPSWVFKSVITNRDWASTLKEESKIGNSTIELDKSGSREKAGWEAYLNTEANYDWTTNMFIGYDGWFFLANEQTVGYYLDPRNFLNEVNIFMFEELYYNESFQNADQITSILGTDKYSNWLIEAGQEYNISSNFLAVRIRQEGTLGGRVTSGTQSVTCTSGNKYSESGTVVYQAPVYNFYNIGATTSLTNADLNGLCYAGSKGWTTEEVAIKEGAGWIYRNYVGNGKYTIYFQKFNTSNANTDISMQYMTNIEAPQSESKLTQKLYKNNNTLNAPFVFNIPIYDNMPEENATRPNLGNPNNWLTSLKVDGTSVSLFSGDKTEYEMTLPYTTESIVVEGITVAKTSYLKINDSDNTLKSLSKEIPLIEGENIITVLVTAGNGNEKTYTIKVTKEAKPDEIEELSIEDIFKNLNLKITDAYISGLTYGLGANTLTEQILEQNKYANIQITTSNDVPKGNGALGTGDKIIITSNKETKTFEVILYGDVNGDGEITGLDLLRVQRHLWKETTIVGSNLIASDVNKDGELTGLDLLRIQRHLWKEFVISQD